MATNVMAHTQQNTGGFLIKWGVVTALLGAVTTILAAHGIIFFVLTAVVGLITGIGQWWLLRDHIRAAWQWILASTLGWIVGYVPAALLAVSVAGDTLGINTIRLLIVGIYLLIFGVMSVTQSFVLYRKGYNGLLWIAASIVGGVLLGTVFQVTCGLGGGSTFFTAMLSNLDGSITPICVEIGATLPRLQSSEPLFNVVPLSYAAHLFGWIAYAAATAFGWKLLLGNK